MAILILTTLIALLLATLAWADRATCTTQFDKKFLVYLTRCTDGRQFKHTYDRGFQSYRMRELPPWKPLEQPRC